MKNLASPGPPSGDNLLLTFADYYHYCYYYYCYYCYYCYYYYYCCCYCYCYLTPVCLQNLVCSTFFTADRFSSFFLFF